MAGAGYNAGHLKGLEFLSDKMARQSEMQARNQEMQIRSEDQSMQRQRFPNLLAQDKASLENSGLERIEKQLSIRKLENEAAKEEYEVNLLKNMQAGTQAATISESQANDAARLAATNRKMGSALMDKDPVKAKKYFDAADGLELSANNRFKTALEIKSKQADEAGPIFSDIHDQETYNAAIPELYALGIQIPPEMRDFDNPKTRDWITKQALKSSYISKELKEQVGYLRTQDELEVDRINNQIKDDRNYHRSVNERLSQIKRNAPTELTAREARYSDTMAISANEAMAAMENIINMPVTVTTGIFGFNLGGDKGTLMSAPLAALKNKVSGSDVQRYNAEISNIGKFYSRMLTGGMSGGDTALSQEGFEKQYAIKQGDTEATKLTKLAQMRQTFERIAEIKRKSKATPDEQKPLWDEWESHVKELIPITVNDINRMENDKNPQKLLKDSLAEASGKTSPIDEKTKTRKSQFKIIRD